MFRECETIREWAAASFLAMVMTWMVAAAPAFGQIVNASLSGTVSDPMGAVIPDANVIAIEVNTGISTTTATDANGNYELPSLSPGMYSVRVEKTGFKATVLSGIQLLVDQKARIDIQLQVGDVSTHVEVVGAAPLTALAPRCVDARHGPAGREVKLRYSPIRAEARGLRR